MCVRMCVHVSIDIMGKAAYLWGVSCSGIKRMLLLSLYAL